MEEREWQPNNLIRPEVIFVFIRVHSWLKTFRPSERRATKTVSARKIEMTAIIDRYQYISGDFKI